MTTQERFPDVARVDARDKVRGATLYGSDHQPPNADTRRDWTRR